MIKNYTLIRKIKNELTALKEILEYENKVEEMRDVNFKEEEQVIKELDELETKQDEELKELEESLNSERVWRKNWGRRKNWGGGSLREKQQK